MTRSRGRAPLVVYKDTDSWQWRYTCRRCDTRSRPHAEHRVAVDEALRHHRWHRDRVPVWGVVGVVVTLLLVAVVLVVLVVAS